MLVLVGVAGYYRLADALAEFDESVDAVGSRRGFESADPAGWKRRLYRTGLAPPAAAGVGLAAWGAALLAGLG